jgi:nucleotide-binding universal stress UspA family protein
VKKVLLAVRDDHDTRWAVDFVIRMHQREPLMIHVLSVQPAWNGHVRMFFTPAQIQRFHEEDAEAELGPVRAALDAARATYVTHVAVGSGAETIASFAQEIGCEQIVVGPMRQGRLAQALLGSLTREVERLMQSSGRRCEVL